MPHTRRPQSWPCIRLHARLAPLAPLTATGHVPDCWDSLSVSAENHLSLSARAKLSHTVTRGSNFSARWTGEEGVILDPPIEISLWATGRPYVRLLPRIPC